MTDKQINEEVISAKLGGAGSAMKNGIVASLKGVNEIEAEIVSLARNTVSDTRGNG